MAELDWASTCLGPMEQWPAHLCTAVGMVLCSPKPMTLLWGDEGIMIYNDAYAVVAGGRHPACLGQPLRSAWPEVAEFNDRLMKTVMAGQPQSYVDHAFTFLRNGRPEEAWLTLDYSPVPGPQGRPEAVLAVVTETTSKILAERSLMQANESLEARVRERTQELQRMEGALRQSQKMEAIGQLTGGIAHDFNNLLQVMFGHLDLVAARQRAGKADEALITRSMASIRAAVSKASRLTQQLLAFARRQKLDNRALNLNTLIEGLAEMARQTLGESIDVRLALAPDLANCQLDANQFEVALLNVLVNARDAMPSGGSIAITTDNVEVRADEPGMPSGLAPGHYVRLAVQDSGSGIPAEILGRVMDPFFTTKEEGKGTGLGLSMVYGFTRQSGGVVDIRSRHGGDAPGTTVCMFFPRCRDDAEDVPPHADQAVRGGSETVLVVDDREEILALARQALEDLGYTVFTASNGPAALELVRQGVGRWSPDLLLSDVVMPGGMDGVSLARALQQRLPCLRVLLATGYAQSLHGQHTGAAVPFDVIAKPYSLQALGQRVRMVLDAAPAPAA